MPQSHLSQILNNVLKGAGIFALVCAGFFFLALRHTSQEIDLTAQDTRKLVAEAQVRLKDTSQNLNAILLQTGLAADEARRASVEQRQYLDTIAKKTIDVLTQTQSTIAQLGDTTQKVGGDVHTMSEATVTAVDSLPSLLEQANKTLQATEKVIADPNIPRTFENVNKVSESLAVTADNVAKTSDHIEKKVAQLVKPASFMKRIVMSILDIGSKIAQIVK
jgi:uncharacterized membrane protein YdfJ with MMPL/SSD domain